MFASRSGRAGTDIAVQKNSMYRTARPTAAETETRRRFNVAIDEGLNNVNYRHRKQYAAETENRAEKTAMPRKEREDLILYVPEGTVIKKSCDRKVIAIMSAITADGCIKRRKRRTWGATFRPSTMQVPKYAVRDNLRGIE